MKTCSISDCAKPSKTRGMCGMHAERVRKYGDPHYASVIVGDPVRRFWSKVDRRGDDECWPWLGTVLANGYGQFKIAGGSVPSHRYSYELNVGPIPDGLAIDHVWAFGCRRTDCVNPSHMEPVTPRENVMRSNAASALNARKEACPRGHAYDTIVNVASGPRRRCSVCHSGATRRSQNREMAS